MTLVGAIDGLVVTNCFENVSSNGDDAAEPPLVIDLERTVGVGSPILPGVGIAEYFGFGRPGEGVCAILIVFPSGLIVAKLVDKPNMGRVYSTREEKVQNQKHIFIK